MYVPPNSNTKYLNRLAGELYAFAGKFGVSISPLTTSISDRKIGEVYLPSRGIFEKLNPHSEPAGLIFRDGSFLVLQEIIRFDYREETHPDPTLYRTKYSYHYQRPSDYFFFRYDHHPDIGDAETHPLHHLHCAGWPPDGTKFQEVPRFEVNETTLAKVLRLILISFPSIVS